MMKAFTPENRSRLDELTRGKATRSPKGLLFGMAIGVVLWAVITLVFHRIFIKG